MTGRLILVGAGALAREALAALRARGGGEPQPAVAGLLDDDRGTHGTTVAGHPVLGPSSLLPELLAADPDARALLCLGNPRRPLVRLEAAERLGVPAERFGTVIHPAAPLADNTEVGPGTLVLAGVVATADVRIGAHVVVMPAAVFTHDDVLGDGVTVTAGVRLAGGVHVGTGAYLGSGALVREGVRIGAGSIIGMGAVVLTDVPDGQVWVGNPARYLRPVQPPDAQTLPARSSPRAEPAGPPTR